jgi:hypothetical protein
MTVEKLLVTRNECRQMGLKYSSMQFLRWEKMELLTPIKPAGRYSRVHYRIEQVKALIEARASQVKPTARKAA